LSLSFLWSSPITKLAIKLFYYNAPEERLFVAQKKCQDLKTVQSFGLNCQVSVKTRNEPRNFFELDLNAYSVLATLLSDMTMGLPPRAWPFYEWRKTAKSKLLFAIVMKDGDPFTFAGLTRIVVRVLYTVVFGVRQKSATSTEPTPTAQPSGT
jgi:hypothetical protein